MQTVIYKLSTNKIVRITSDNVGISNIKNDEDFCPLSFFEQTEDGRKHLEEYYSKI